MQDVRSPLLACTPYTSTTYYVIHYNHQCFLADVTPVFTFFQLSGLTLEIKHLNSTYTKCIET